MNEIRFIDLFSGIGGFRLGLEKANLRSTQQEDNQALYDTENELDDGKPNDSRPTRTAAEEVGAPRHSPNTEKGDSWKPTFSCVWSNDFNKYASQIYTKNFGEEGHTPGDIRTVNPEKIPDFDLLCGGFPCQSFSIAGKRKGFEDTRGTLFFEICRIIEAKRPSLLLLENVKGLLNHNKGRTFTTIIQALDELGYWVEWQVLNSKHFGVPQNRERVFIIGHLRGTGGREIFPIFQDDVHRFEGIKTQSGGQIGAALTGRSAGGNNARGNYVAHCIDANYHKGTSALNSIKKSQRQLVVGNEAFTDIDQVLSGFKIRRLTPIECERLQGFPDGWTEGVSNTQRYKCLGNAVTVNVIEFLGERILQTLATKAIE